MASKPRNGSEGEFKFQNAMTLLSFVAAQGREFLPERSDETFVELSLCKKLLDGRPFEKYGWFDPFEVSGFKPRETDLNRVLRY